MEAYSMILLILNILLKANVLLLSSKKPALVSAYKRQSKTVQTNYESRLEKRLRTYLFIISYVAEIMTNVILLVVSLLCCSKH